MDEAAEQVVLDETEENKMEREEIKSILESLLFVADGPQSVQRLADSIDGVDQKLIQEISAELQN